MRRLHRGHHLQLGQTAEILSLIHICTVSVFSANDCARGVIETGMLYSLDDEDLSNRTSRGVSNELVGKPARIAVEEGTLYVFYPLP